MIVDNNLLIIFSGVGFVIIAYFLWNNYRVNKVIAKHEQDMSRRMYEISILKELGDRIGYSLDLQQIVDVIISSLHQFIDYSAISYMLLEPEKVIFKIHLDKSVNEKFIDDVKDRMLGSLSALLNKEFNKNDVKEIISGAIISEDLADPVRSFFNIPLVIDENVVGVMTVAHTKAGLYKDEEMTILYKIIGQASKAVTRLQSVVKTEEAKVNAMVESMEDGVVMTDLDYRIMVANPKARAAIGLPDKQNITIFDFIDNLEGKFDMRGKLEESVKLSKTFQSDEILIKDKFYRIFVFPVSASISGQKSIVGGVVIFHDVSAERSVQQMREQFTSMLVHELRAPLSGINKLGELMRSGPEKINKKDYEEYIKLINTDTKNMLELVNDILDVSKLDAGKFDIRKSPTDIKTIVDNRITFFKPSADDAKISLKSSFDPELPEKISVDENSIKQVLNNLISNSLKFTKAGGAVEIYAVHHKEKAKVSEEFKRLNEKPALVLPDDKFENTKDSVVVAVSDNGSGIDENQIKELFNKFKQFVNKTDSLVRGTGLGLAIAKGIVEEHGGFIGVVSKVDVGSVFYFVLPLN